VHGDYKFAGLFGHFRELPGKAVPLLVNCTCHVILNFFIRSIKRRWKQAHPPNGQVWDVFGSVIWYSRLRSVFTIGDIGNERVCYTEACSQNRNQTKRE
jgi:hypothetical protein